MHFLQFVFATLLTAQVYYLYKFIYSIPIRYEIPETENEYAEIESLLRGRINGTFHGTHKRKHQRRPHLEQMKSDNNTALTYTPSTSLDAVDRF